MNTATLLKKCIDKIKAMTGNDAEIQYVLGILETLYEMQTPAADTLRSTASGSPIKLPVNIVKDPAVPDRELTEAEILDKQAQERLKSIKDLAN